MARGLDFDALTAEWEPRLRDAFLRAVAEIANRVQISTVAQLLDRGDIEGAVRAVGIDELDFRDLDSLIAQSFDAGGKATETAIPALREPLGGVVRFRFDVRNPRAEEWARERSSTLVREIVEDQRTAIRQSMASGLERGLNPRTVALDLAGRMPAGRNERVGGIIGLTSQQERWVAAYAEELTSGDPEAMRNALKRGLRDKRFDRTIEKAIREGKPLPADTVARLRTLYASRALKYRADVISRNETIRALGAAQTEAYDQAIERGNVQEGSIRKFWFTARDERVRSTHRMIPGMNKDGRAWKEPFATPTGPSMHAPHSIDIMCRCHERVRIDYFASLRQAA
ncbi:MAG TPA: phage minor head protein [Mesorhizobium sp.]|jgi:hypothetical protein|nr:phage minor head protein [Mesorhizobium sp.]